MVKIDQETEPTEEELTDAIQHAVNGTTPEDDDKTESSEEEQAQEEDQDDPKEEEQQEEEEQEEEADDSQDQDDPKDDDTAEEEDTPKAKTTAKEKRITAKKNKWKQKYLDTKKQLDKLKANPDDNADKIQQSESDLRYAENRYEELQEEELESFFDENPQAKEIEEEISEVMNSSGLGIYDAYTLYLAKNSPEQLYDQQKINQSKGGTKMKGKGGSSSGTAPKNLEEMSVDELENQLQSEHKKGNNIL